jgi:hypothetical protein
LFQPVYIQHSKNSFLLIKTGVMMQIGRESAINRELGGSTYPEAVCLVRCLGHSQLVSSLSPLVNKLFGGILSWAQTLIRSFTERQLSLIAHAYLVHNSCQNHSQGTKNTKIKFMPVSFTTCV